MSSHTHPDSRFVNSDTCDFCGKEFYPGEHYGMWSSINGMVNCCQKCARNALPRLIADSVPLVSPGAITSHQVNIQLEKDMLTSYRASRLGKALSVVQDHQASLLPRQPSPVTAVGKKH